MELVLHERARLALEVVKAHPAGSYLFYGPESVGKATAALELARALNCTGPHPAATPCPPCAQFAAGSYPDLIVVAPEDKPSLTIEQIRRLAATLSLQPYYETGVRLVVIDDAQALTTDAANALLKLLEEPPPRTVFVLVAPAAESLLPTVRSRCAAVYFPVPPRDATVALVAARAGLDPTAAARLIDAADGAPGAALTLAADSGQAAARLELASQAAAAITQTRFDRLRLAATLVAAAADLNRFARLLHRQLLTGLRDQTVPAPAATRGLAAVEQFRRQTSAKVSPRVALERLMLEL